MSNQESLLQVAAKGAIAGIAGTAALTVGMQLMPQVMAPLGMAEGQRDDQPEEPNVRLVEKATLVLWGKVPEQATKMVGGQFIHWGYGATWGAMYGLAQQQLQLPHHMHGLLLGAVIGTVASTVVPAMALTPPPTRQPVAETVMMTGLQLLYGWVTAQMFYALSTSGQEQQPRPPWHDGSGRQLQQPPSAAYVYGRMSAQAYS
ncbi:MAG: hypothetical protein R3E79_58695 [Caldilineaceae bacterium]